MIGQLLSTKTDQRTPETSKFPGCGIANGRKFRGFLRGPDVATSCACKQIQSFRDLAVWQRSMILVEEIYLVTSKISP